jgi:hypothetical protein
MRIPTNQYRVTKYNPAFRDQSGAYIKDEWTFFGQIGQTFSGVLFTADEYERVEQAYVQTAFSFLRESGVLSLRIVGLENSRMQPLDFQNDSVLTLDRIGEIIRRILRDEFWCRLEGGGGFIHFGWDYYMYIGVPHPCPTAQALAVELGLYVEVFASPHVGDEDELCRIPGFQPPVSIPLTNEFEVVDSLVYSPPAFPGALQLPAMHGIALR